MKGIDERLISLLIPSLLLVARQNEDREMTFIWCTD